MQATSVADDMAVALHYTLRLDNDELVDASDIGEPFWFIQGRGHIVEGLEEALYGLTVGQEKQIVVEPDAGYGEYDDDAFQVLPIEDFPDEMEITVGMAVELYDEEEDVAFEAYIAEISDGEVVLDLNHPLAGETLYFDVKVEAIRPATAEELAHDHVHVSGHDHP